MRLRIQNCDITFELKIKNWRESTSALDAENNWTTDEMSLRGPYIQYHFDEEVILGKEVRLLRDAFGNLLNGSQTDETEIELIEPDLLFKLSPAKRLCDVPNRVYYEDGYMDVDVLVEMLVNFWCADGCLGSNYFSMTFDREQIDAFYTYLRTIMCEISPKDVHVQELVTKGLLLLE